MQRVEEVWAIYQDDLVALTVWLVYCRQTDAHIVPGGRLDTPVIDAPGHVYNHLLRDQVLIRVQLIDIEQRSHVWSSAVVLQSGIDLPLDFISTPDLAIEGLHVDEVAIKSGLKTPHVEGRVGVAKSKDLSPLRLADPFPGAILFYSGYLISHKRAVLGGVVLKPVYQISLVKTDI